jgi:UDP-N-acetylmuramoylalanine--D-glutamate ligase
MTTPNYHGLNVTVMGLGTFGGQVGAVRFLVARGARVTVTDLRSAAQLAPSIAQLSDTPPQVWRLGEHRLDDFTSADLVVASPAIALTDPYLQAARERGIPVTREMNLFWQHNRGRVIGVTGTNGKSTTTALTHELMSRAFPGRTWLGGNIGKSLLPDVDRIQPGDWVVLELSSFQLEDLAPLRPDVEVAVVTNFTPNHLDRHETVAKYRGAKQTLLRTMSPGRIAILNQDDPDVAAWPTAARVFWFGMDDTGREGTFVHGTDPFPRRAIFRLGQREQVLPLGEWLTLPGRHNLRNALAATTAALTLGAQASHVEEGVRAFRGLPHRLELVAERGGVRYYNDSKSTTPEATVLALRSFRAPVWLIAGGYDKRIDLGPMIREACERPVRGVACVGQTGPALRDALLAGAPDLLVTLSESVTEATGWCAARATEGEIVLLSPGCASVDQFENYEQRGKVFAEAARGG